MMKSKNLISIFLVLVSIISFIHFEVRADSELKENSWRYKDGIPIPTQNENIYNDFDVESMSSPTMKGIDVSTHQGSIDWNSVKNDIDYAIIRCGYGSDNTSQDDKQWYNNVSECTRLGIPFGVYIYSYAENTTEAASEAKHVLRLVNGYNLSFPIYFDMEDKVQGALSSGMRGAIAKTFCDAIQSAGYEVGIYANKNWWENYLTDAVFNNNSWFKWVAQYNSTCTYSGSYTMWQYTSSGSVNGISGNVDMNYWYGEKRGVNNKEPADLGTDFYAYIFNKPCWKTVASGGNGGNTYLETEKWTANQRWYCTRNDDGSYTFKNAVNNKCLSVENAGNSNGTNVQIADYTGSDAQKWFIYSSNGAYVFSPKCANGKVLNLYNGSTDDGIKVQIYDENDSDAQIFTLHKVDVTAGKPEIKSNVEVMKTDGAANISWNSTEYTDHYMYYLTEYPVAYAYSTNTANGSVSNTSVNFNNLTSGSYSCFVQAVSHQNNLGEQSNWVSFKVYADDYIPTKTVVYNDHIYALYDYEMSWTFARELCNDLGGHLVTVTTADENKVITDLIQSGSKDAYWLGASDITDYGKLEYTEKKFNWVTGENCSYSNWGDGEPSSSGENGEKEHFAEIRKSSGNKWNDVNNINKSNKGFILEIEMPDYTPTVTKTYNGNQYMIFDKNTTWSEAKIFCEKLGGHLVTIESAEEQAFVQDLLKDGERIWYYLGGQKRNDVWTWLDGDTAEYVSLADNAAKWNGTNLMMYKSTGKCIGINNAYYPEKDISNIGFVCEIEEQSDHKPTFSITDHDTYVEILNDSDIANTATVIIAEYDNYCLVNLMSIETSFAANENRTLLVGSGKKYKVFVWDSLKGMIPLTK